jgi:hypothetical protein
MKRIVVYLWASPATVLGLVFVALARVSGGKVQLVDGVLEASGDLIRRFLRSRIFIVQKPAAMTLGHVILGQNEAILAANRNHERVHVAQYERWGPLMIPLYLLSSCAARLRGEDAYWANHFERRAYHQAHNPHARRD